MALISQRNSKMFVKLGGAGYASSPNPASPLVGVSDNSPDRNTWEVPILAGFSFGQTTNSTEVTVNEAGFTSRRARVMFNDSLAPVEFSFSTYIRPTEGTGPTKVVAPEQVLWAMLMGADSFNATTGRYYSSMQMNATSPGTVSPSASPNFFQAINSGTTSATSDTFDFSASNTSFFPQGNTVFFQVGDASNFELFSISNAQISSVTIDFDIEGIATAQWTGMGTSISRSSGATNTLAGAFNQGTTQTTNFIRNKLSTITLSSFRDPGAQSPSSPAGVPGEDTYSIVLTGGSFTIENNLNFLMPEELGKVNQTVGNITGTRTISGSLTCYYDSSVSTDKSAELWQDLITGSSGSPVSAGTAPTIRNAHNLAINVGGTNGNRLILNIPTAHFEIPTINPDELFTLEANFHAVPPSGNFDRTDEAAITYAI
jgi:hypothetical protein